MILEVYTLPSLLRAESLLSLALPGGAFQRLKQVLSTVSRAGLAETAGPSPEFCPLFLGN